MMQSRLLRARSLALCSLLAVTLGACSLGKINRQSTVLENLATLEGRVKIETDQPGQVYVLLYRYRGLGLEVVNRQPLHKDGSYFFWVDAGTYALGTYVDINGDEEYFGEEPATYLGEARGDPTLIVLQEKQSRVVPELVITRVLVRQPEAPVVSELSMTASNVGRVVSLSDERFSQEHSKQGLWHPVDFLDTLGAGLFMLQEYETGKTPVVFVHGINGSPANFTEVIAGLDREHFQPWVLHYPSGLRLAMVSEYLLQSLEQLQEKHGFPRVYLVAHSMGGLMTRSFVIKHREAQSSMALGLVVTINSPLYGMDSAASGVRTSPVVLPVWRDVASNSDYVRQVHEEPWPSNVPYHLVFSYQDKKDGDGVVPLRSQLSRSLQREARQIHGFNAEHSRILEDQDFIRELNRILSEPAG